MGSPPLKTLHQLNNRYGPYRSPVTRAFLMAPFDKLLDNRHIWPSVKPGQSIMVKLPCIGTVPMTLTKSQGTMVWEAIDNSGAEHRISARWI